MRDYNIVVDCNHFCYSRLHVLPKPKSIPGLPDMKLLDDPNDVAMFVRKLTMDFASEIRKLKNLTKRIILTYDAKSWRKDFFPEADYKGNRTADDSINWTNVSLAMNEFAKCLSNFSELFCKFFVFSLKFSGKKFYRDILFCLSHG